MKKNIEFDQRTLDLIDKLKKAHGLKKKSEVIKRAIAFLDTIEQIEAQGAKLAVMDADGNLKELIIHYLEE